MVITIDILCPERTETLVPEPKAHTDEKPTYDRAKVTRLQVINIRGQLVDVEQ